MRVHFLMGEKGASGRFLQAKELSWAMSNRTNHEKTGDFISSHMKHITLISVRTITLTILNKINCEDKFT
ncbi:hypothetical cytosolic protein [Syntrophus aciditrophicus SB]|uniref:Hypothetical cytosolic protein n=1 Tax=Syntrophus aciditrophicus (strain SB) TaxID=56780 RepID=Q2LPT4_SYNAS|nr:hypothetical cytosolic protein [Syntrophus aciditrophicus SB]